MAQGLNEVVQLARKMEIDGAKFYAGAAAKAVSPQATRLFESFAKDEQRHLEIVEALAKSLGVDVESMPMPADTIKTVFREAEGQISAKQEVTADEPGAIKTAMQMERDSYKLYADAEQATEDAAQKSVIHRLAEEENQHYEMLENTQQYLADNQKWFLWKEWGLLTGDMSSLGQ